MASGAPKSCCIVGGGPAGMMLAYLLARRGVPVTVLEKHADFLRDFRGDTVHPSTQMALEQSGLLPRFRALPQSRLDQLTIRVGDIEQTMVDFRGLKPFDHIALVPQWDFLNMLAEAGEELPLFNLHMEHDAIELLHEGDRVCGVRVDTPDGERTYEADLVVACDGRSSTLRDRSGLQVEELGAPMDVLWFRMPKPDSGGAGPFAILGAGNALVLLDRTTYFQCAYILSKGGDAALRREPVETFRRSVGSLAPELAPVTDHIRCWDDVKTLEVKVDRLRTWHRPGLLLIGDAAHAMSPIGGVGINLAIQDAVTAANRLAPVMARGQAVPERLLQEIQLRRLPAVKKIQTMQVAAQNNVISAVLAAKSEPPKLPRLVRWLFGYRFIRNIPARIIGYGFNREDVA
jgi:2-polyprenyl-6-methoxyphenol hydroxylase-like FAD-dependent oxidoreductase